MVSKVTLWVYSLLKLNQYSEHNASPGTHPKWPKGQPCKPTADCLVYRFYAGSVGRASQAKPETCMRRRARPTCHHQLGTAIHDRNPTHRLYKGVCTSLLGLPQSMLCHWLQVYGNLRFLCCRSTYSSHWSSLTAWICSDVKFIAGYVVVAWHEYRVHKC